MRVFLVVLLAAAALLPSGHDLSAQVTPADSAAVLLDAANTFLARDQPDLAAALHRLILERFPDSPAAAAARLALNDGPSAVASNGATELQVWSTTYGAWLGVAVPGAFGVDDTQGYGVGLLVGAPLGFLTGRAVVRSMNPTIGQARAITFGGTWGTWQGFGWREVLDLGEEEFDCGGGVVCTGGDTTEETFAAMLVGGAAGITVGALLGRASVSDAVATGANTGALWGSGIGGAVGGLLDLEDDDLLAAALVGGNVGLAAAALATPALGFSRNQWRMVSLGGVIGGLAGLGLDLLIEPDDDKVAIAIPLATGVAGLAIGGATSRPSGPREPSRNAGPGGLLEIDRDGIALGTPAFTPRRLPVQTVDGTRWRTTMGIHWLRVSTGPTR